MTGYRAPVGYRSAVPYTGGGTGGFDPHQLPLVAWVRAKDIVDHSRIIWPQAISGAEDVYCGKPAIMAEGSTPAGGTSVRYDGTYKTQFQVFPSQFALQRLTLDSASSSYSTSYDASLALDGDASTAWVAGGTATATAPEWLILTQGTPEPVTTYEITPRASWASHAPGDWRFEGSDDKSAWTLLDARSGITFADGVKQSFAVTGPTGAAFTYYRLYVTAVPAVGCDIGEVGFNGHPAADWRSGEAWIVLRSDDVRGAPFWMLGTSTQGSHMTFDGVVYDDAGASTRQSFTPTMPIANTWHIYRVTSDGTWTAYLDGVQQAQVAGVPVRWAGGGFIGGSTYTGDSSFVGNVAEFLWMNDRLTADQADGLYSYLRTEHFPTDGAKRIALSAATATARSFVTAPVVTAMVTFRAFAMTMQMSALPDPDPDPDPDDGPANGGGDILLEVTSDVDSTPSWVRVNVTNGDPDGTADITVDDDPTVLLSIDLDESGQAIGVSVPLDELEAGEHVLRTGVATATFTVASGPVAYPVARVPDRAPVPPEVNRWALQDPTSDGVTYVFPINPARMSSPHAARVFTTEHTTAADGQPLTFEGSPVGVDWSFEGTVQTQSFYDSLEAFLAAGRRLFCFDHLDRIWEISLESIDWEPVRDSRYPWAHRYKAKAIIYGQVQP